MSRKSSKKKHEYRSEPEGAARSSSPDDRAWFPDQSRTAEPAPSLLRQDEPQFARLVGLVALFCLVLGSAIQLLSTAGRKSFFDANWAWVFIPLGVAGLLFHAVSDADLQVRRLYGFLGSILLVLGAGLCAAPLFGAPLVLVGYGFLCLLLALFLLLAFARHETDKEWRGRSIIALGGAGAVMALTGFIGGIVWKDFLSPCGLILAILGLGYLWGFTRLRGSLDPLGTLAGQVIGVTGLVVFLVALGWTILPPLFYSWRWISESPEAYLVPYGLLLMGGGVLYGDFAVAYHSERPVVVLTRRELAAFFYSPIAYLVLLGLTVVGAIMFAYFVLQLLFTSSHGIPLQEPIVKDYILSLAPVVCVIFIVPVLTMRLLSEEQRTGTLEVLLTAPVGEWSVVLSKFLAGWLLYMLIWAPWGLFLVALRIENGRAFEYRPLLGFFLVQMCTGAGFIAIGLFFSSLTRNQIIAAVMTFAAMLLSILAYFVEFILTRMQSEAVAASPWPTVLAHVNFIDLWITALDGVLSPRALLFHVCVAIFCLFVTVKVLESRKWR